MVKEPNFEVVLVAPPARASTPRPPLGLMYIAAFLRERNCKCKIIDIKSKENIDKVAERIVKELKKLNPSVTGITCMTSDLKDVITLTKKIKREINTKIVVGGVHPTIAPNDFLYKNSCVDYLVFSEGETAFYELVTAIKNRKNPENVKGIAYFENEIIITKNKPMEDLDKLPQPAYDLIDMGYYTKPNLYAIRGVLISAFYIFTSRGCPFRCSFCVNKNLFGRTIRYQDPQKVVDEIEFLIKNYNIDAFYIYDDTFTINKNRVIEICNEIMKRKSKIIWACETRVDLITEDLIKIMKKAGCIQIDFGVESGSQKILNILQKDITIEQIKKAFNICKSYGIRTFANFMINNPDETEEDINLTLKLAKEIKPTITTFNVTTPFPGSDLYDKFGKQISYDNYSYMASMASYKDFITFIESECKLSKHNLNLYKVLQHIWREFPGAQDFSLKFNLNYFKQIFRELSFVFNPTYLKQIIKSKRKREYIKTMFFMVLRRDVK